MEHPQTVTAHQLLDQMAQAVKDLGPEPIGEWMRSKGYPPEEYMLVLPLSLKDTFSGRDAATTGPLFWPSYVLFSAHVSEPVVYLKSPIRKRYGWPFTRPCLINSGFPLTVKHT